MIDSNRGISRREFLRYSASASLLLTPLSSALLFSSNASAHPQDSYLVSPSMILENGLSLCTVYNMGRGYLSYVKTPLRQAHGAVFAPMRPRSAYVIDSSGPLACEIDLRESRVTRTFSCRDGNLFGGHGFVSADGTLYISEYNKTSLQGQIVGRRLSDLKVVNVLDSGGFKPHQIDYIPGEKAFAVANEGSALNGCISSISLISADNGKLIATSPGESADITFRHLDISAEGDVCLAVKKIAFRKEFDYGHYLKLFVEKNFREAYLYGSSMSVFSPMPFLIFTANHELKEIAPSPDFLPYMTNSNAIAVDKRRGIALLSSSGGNCASFWDIASGRLLYHYSNPSFIPLGVDFDPNTDSFLLSTNKQDLYQFQYPLGSPRKIVASRLLSFAHLYVNNS